MHRALAMKVQNEENLFLMSRCLTDQIDSFLGPFSPKRDHGHLLRRKKTQEQRGSEWITDVTKSVATATRRPCFRPDQMHAVTRTTRRDDEALVIGVC
jgi:hypothetical protein